MRTNIELAEKHLDSIFNIDENRDIMWDMCLNYKIGKNDSVPNHLAGSEPDIDKMSFQTFLYECAREPYLNPYDAFMGTEVNDFHRIGKVVAIKLEDAAEQIASIAGTKTNKYDKQDVETKTKAILDAKARVEKIRNQMEHMVGSRDGSIKVDPMFAVASAAYPGTRTDMIKAMVCVNDLLVELNADIKKFAERTAPDHVYSFPEYQEEGTAKEIFTNIRNGYYDFKEDALTEFSAMFDKEHMEHEKNYTDANIGYCKAKHIDDELSAYFFQFIMDVEDNKRMHDYRREIGMEEYLSDDFTVNAFYDKDEERVTVSVDRIDTTTGNVTANNVAAYAYDEFREMSAEQFKSAVNEILFYAQEQDYSDMAEDR